MLWRPFLSEKTVNSLFFLICTDFLILGCPHGLWVSYFGSSFLCFDVCGPLLCYFPAPGASVGLPASGLLWISSPDSLGFISLLALNHLLPAFSIKGNLCVLIANYLIFDYFLLLVSSSFLLATWIVGSLHQYHSVKMQTPGPTADRSNQDAGYGARASCTFTGMPCGF